MPKKQAKPNAFLFFMLEWKSKEEKKGRTFPNGLKDVQTDPECNAIWKSLSEQEKVVYKTMEKTSKKKPELNKKTGLGENLSDIERAEMKKKEFIDNMIEYISKIIYEAKNKNSVQKLKFCVIHVNFFYGRHLEIINEMEYHPAEIALAEFSLEDGITRVYHQIINEKIAMGFTGAAKDHSNNSHHIPLNAPFGKNNYREIFHEICAFLNPNRQNGRLPPLFTMFTKDDVYQPAKSVLSKLARSDRKGDDYLLLYSFEDLFAYLHNATIEQMGITKIEPIIATIELKKDPFAYKSGLDCDFHEELKAGSVYCSLSIVKRWIYVLFSFCCHSLGITMIPGVHKPHSIDLNDNANLMNASFSTLSLNDSRLSASALSMTGVSLEHRQRVSERTQREEQRRRNEVNGISIEIIDHSALNSQMRKPQEPIERPLRPPHTKSAGTTYFDSTDAESIDFSENSFPSIGRGSAIRKRTKETKSYATISKS